MEENVIPHEQPLKEEIELLDSLRDRNRRWRCVGANCRDSCCGLRFQQARIFIHEVFHLSQYFPLTFNVLVRPGEKKEISLVVLLRTALEKTPCFYLNEGVGCSLGEERPLSCKQFPFCMVRDQAGEYCIALKPSCPGLSDESGASIFMPDGSINPVIYQECIKPAMSVAEAAEETQTFVETLVKHDLISVGCCDHRGEKLFLHVVNAQKFCALPKEVLDSFRSNGYTDLILAHVNSAVHCRKLIDRDIQRKTSPA